jgi:signal recognition particle receptor subunit beta
VPATLVDPLEPVLEQARGVLRRVHECAQAAGRADVAAELAVASARAEDDVVTVVVSGETGRGKSALINAVLDRPGLLPVGAESATARHVLVRRRADGEREGALAHCAGGEVVPVALDDLATWVTVDGEAARDGRVTHVEIALEHPLLRDGVALVDTPGVGGLGRAHGEAARAALRMGEALLLVVDAGAPLSAVELRVLDEAARLAGPAAVAVNRKDVHPGWEHIVREDELLLAQRRDDQPPPVIAVSARMKSRADRLAAEARRPLATDSGVPALRSRLLGLCRERSAHLRSANLCRASRRAVEDLLAPERAALLAEAARVAERAASARQVRTSIAELEAYAQRQRASIVDELADLHRRADAELRGRCLRVQRELLAGLKDAGEDKLAQELEAALYCLQDEIVAFAGQELERLGESVATAARRHGVDLESWTADLQERTVVQVAPGGKVELDVRQLVSQLVLRGGVIAPAAIVASPVLPVVAGVSALGMAMVVFERLGQGRRQQRAEQIRETVGTLQIELAPLLARAVLGARRGLEANLDHALRRRRSELQRTAQHLGATEREAAGRQAAQSVADLEELLAEIERVERSALPALTSALPRAATARRTAGS